MSTLTQLEYPVKCLKADIVFGDEGTETIGFLPPNAVVFNIKVSVQTAFDSGTTDVLTIGHAAFGSTALDVDEFEASIDLTGTEDLTLTLLRLGVVLSADLSVGVTYTYTSAGTAPTAGAATIMIEYFQQ